MIRNVAVVGAGLAGAAVVSTLRAEGFEGRITLIGAEPHLPYERPPLSKGLLRGATTADDARVFPPRWYADHAVDAQVGRRAVRIVTSDRAVELDDGETVGADAVVLTTGGRPRTIPGVAGQRICYLRTLEDAARLAVHLGPAQRLVTVGLGFVGAEVAASARQTGTGVVALERLSVPLEPLLGQELGAVCAELHLDHGVEVHTEAQITSISEGADSVTVRTATGLALEGDAVVIGVGMSPDTDVAESSGIVVDNGIVVDEFGRTSQPGVWAAGDVANHYHPPSGRHVRVEHYDNALRHGAAVARDILGHGAPYDRLHWFWSDQYGHDLQHVGDALGWDRAVVRGEVEERDLVAFYLRSGVVRAAFGINRSRDVRAAKALIRNRMAPEPALLADPDVDLESLARR